MTALHLPARTSRPLRPCRTTENDGLLEGISFRIKFSSTHHRHNNMVVLMIPALIDLGPPTPWPVLPPGIHDTDLAEIEAVFATTPHRRKLFDGLTRAAAALAQVGCTVLYVDGSFVTGKDHPGDFDACWDHRGMDLTRLDPVLLTFANKRAAQKRKYFGEMFWALGPGNSGGTSFLELFQNDKESGRPKGILRVSLKPPFAGATP